MPETTSSRNSGHEWTQEQVRQLRELAEGNTPVGGDEHEARRTEDAIRSKVQSKEECNFSRRTRSAKAGTIRARRSAGRARSATSCRWPTGEAD
jgi:hypothetical protein